MVLRAKDVAELEQRCSSCTRLEGTGDGFGLDMHEQHTADPSSEAEAALADGCRGCRGCRGSMERCRREANVIDE